MRNDRPILRRTAAIAVAALTAGALSAVGPTSSPAGAGTFPGTDPGIGG